MRILVKNGRLVNPAVGDDGVRDVLIEDGLFARVGKGLRAAGAVVVDARGMYVLPGLVDLHCHLREPGREDEETILSGAAAALSGGYTTVCCMPNTEPPLDNKVAVRYVCDRARETPCEVLPVGCLTLKREGASIAPYGEMAEAGAVAFSDDGACVLNSLVMRRALEYTRVFGKPAISHAEDQNLSRNGAMNEGLLATKLGLAGIPRQAEEIMVARDIALARLTGGRLHLAHVTTAEAVALVRRAKKETAGITCEAAVHHFILTEQAVEGYNTYAKMSPPLRTEKDIEALRKGMKDGTIDCIVTDHAPHSEEEKEIGFENAPFGVIGFETALPLAFTLAEHGFSPSEIVSLLTAGPARVMGLERGVVAEGRRADLVVFDPKREWVYEKAAIRSKSRNSPFIGRTLKGKVICTIAAGTIAHRESR